MNFQHGKFQPNWLAFLKVLAKIKASENGLILRSQRQAYLSAVLLV